MIVERRLSAHLDWSLIAALLALSLIGLGTIYSVTWDARPGHDTAGPEFWVQVYALPVGLAALGLCLLVDYRTLTQRWLWFYVALLISLLYVRFNGHVSGGAGRWIRIGRISLQPSEFARMTVALVLAMFYGESRRTAKSIAMSMMPCDSCPLSFLSLRNGWKYRCRPGASRSQSIVSTRLPELASTQATLARAIERPVPPL